MKRITLFMLPYAGGSASVYLNWRKFMPSEVEISPLELPGRGRRYKEPLIDSAPAMVPDLIQSMKESGLSTPYAIFGHSMGSLLALETACELAKQGEPLPAALFLSGRNSPDVKVKQTYHHLPEPELLQEVIKMGGTPPELIENRELIELFLPIIRSDFKLVETYHYEQEMPLDCPFFILNGKKDAFIDSYDIENWSRFTLKPYSVKWFEGGHFYIHEQTRELCQYICQQLLSLSSPNHLPVAEQYSN